MIWVFLSLALGGVLKGATGAGAPVVAVPVMAMFYGVDFAVATMIVPNLLNNVWQGWQFRKSALSGRFMVVFCAAGMVGAVLGTWLLVTLSPTILTLIVAVGVFAYIGFRLAKPGWVVPGWLHQPLAGPVGVLAGVMQGASGVSAPVSITFLNALRLSRPAFIGTISIYFATMSMVQLPAMALSGVLTWNRLAISFGALLILSTFMPVGNWLGKRISKEAFDKSTLVLLFLIAIKIVVDAVRKGAV